MHWPVFAIVVVSFGPAFPCDDEFAGPIAKSGDAEIQQIAITRERVAYASKDADLTFMKLALWLPLKGNDVGDGYLVRLNELQPIEDGSGKQLLSKIRLVDNAELFAEVRAHETQGRGGLTGPLLPLMLDAPSRGATRLKLVKGRATVHRIVEEKVSFEKFGSLVGKPLDHPKLKDFKTTPTLATERSSREVGLNLPARHGRLREWSLLKGGRKLQPYTHSWRPDETGVAGAVTQSYIGEDVKDCTLELLLAVPVETRTFSFEFKDVELP